MDALPVINNSCEQGCTVLCTPAHLSTSQAWTKSSAPLPLAAGDRLVDRQQNDGTQQCYQQGWEGDGLVDCPDTQQRGDKPTSNESADDAYHDIEQQALLRIRSHDPTGNITADRSSNEIYDEVHFFFSFLNVSNTRLPVFGCP